MKIEQLATIPGAVRVLFSRSQRRTSLRARAVRGSFWMAIGHGSHQLLRLVGNLTLAHLLFPEAFGLMALVTIFLHGLRMFSDVGIRGSILYHKHGENPAFYNTAWSMQIIRGFVLWIIACLLAYPASVFYEEPLLAAMLPIAGLTAVFAGFRSTMLYTAQRRVYLGRIVAIDLGSYAIGVVATIVWAFMYPTVWALVGGMMMGSLLHTVMSHTLLPGPRNRLHWDKPAFRSMVRFGKWVLISTAATFLAINLDRLLLGKLVPMDLLGVYSIAYLLAKTPGRFSSEVMKLVLHPVYSEIARRKDGQLSEKVQMAREPVLLAGLALAMGIIFFAPAFFSLYPVAFHDAAWMAPLLTVPVWFMLLQNSCDRALLAMGDSKSSALANVVNSTMTLVGCIAGFHVAGVPGLIFGTAGGNLAGLIVVHGCLHRRGITLFKADVMYTVAFAVMLIAGLSIAAFSQQFLPDGHAIVHLIVVPVLAFAIGIALIVSRLYQVLVRRHGEPKQVPLAVEGIGA